MTAELIAEQGVLKGLILALGDGQEWVIGRDPDLCNRVIEDPNVSRKHLRIVTTEQGYLAENLSETDPVLVNGVPFDESVVLSEGDRLTVGSSVFVFSVDVSDEAVIFRDQPAGEEALDEEFLSEAPVEEEIETDALFEEPEIPAMQVDLGETTRYILKVIAGPNTGAEIALDLEREYLIGTDAASCDIVFNDLSVSREHARLRIDAQGALIIEDLNSRNGIVIENERIEGSVSLAANAVVTVGTSAFLLIDREAPSETIAAPVFELPVEEEQQERVEEEVVAVKEAERKPSMTAGTLVLSVIIGGLAILLGVGMFSLFQTQEVEYEQKDYLKDIEHVIRDFPGVRYTYNSSSGQLFLMGHVKTGIEMNELLYKLHGLPFLKNVENNVVNDEAVWQEMNILLSKHSEFKGVSMHSPQPGEFVINGYLQTEKQASDLTDYLNLNFNYISLLNNRVIVDQGVTEEVTSAMVQHGFGAVTVAFMNGDLQLTGYISSTQLYEFEQVLERLKKIPGVRSVRNFVVAVTPEQGVIDLNTKYPGRYRVTGSSQHGDINVNVVINGKILTRGDSIDAYTITSIQPQTIFLEKDGLKYKIEYNK
ncbi:MAG: hypothetical protein S4CHLAM123_01940 [Chlamydiales bacterium]|nr:hypothetical protein [Chlamydiales bacterium]